MRNLVCSPGSDTRCLSHGFDVTSLNSRPGLRRSGAARHNPQFNAILFTIAAIKNNDSGLVDSSLTCQVLERARTEAICLTSAAATPGVGNDVGGCRRIILEFDGQVIEPSLLI